MTGASGDRWVAKQERRVFEQRDLFWATRNAERLTEQVLFARTTGTARLLVPRLVLDVSRL